MPHTHSVFRQRSVAPGWVFCLLWLVFCAALPAAETIPPAPTKYFNDYAGVVEPAVAEQLNRQLEQFERQSSSQILVVVYPKMQSDSSIEDYTFRLAEAWKVGQKGRDNGAVLFVFIQDRKLFIQVGYGLEGAIPDATAKQIIETVIKPWFKNGDYTGGLREGVAALMAAARGEYAGTGRTVAEGGGGRGGAGLVPLVVFALIVFLILPVLFRGRRRRRYGGWGGWTVGSGGMSSGQWGRGGSWGGGGGGGWGGGGGFSGGGGRFGGGGAGGSW